MIQEGKRVRFDDIARGTRMAVAADISKAEQLERPYALNHDGTVFRLVHLAKRPFGHIQQPLFDGDGYKGKSRNNANGELEIRLVPTNKVRGVWQEVPVEFLSGDFRTKIEEYRRRGQRGRDLKQQYEEWLYGRRSARYV